MPKRDLYHHAVRNGLEKEGWIITADPLEFMVGGVDFSIDLTADFLIGAERKGEKIAVEIKSFLEQSSAYAFHRALGQYENYEMALEEHEADRIIYLAVPAGIYNTFFQKPFIQKVVQRKNLRLIVYSPIEEIILKWIK
jgi:XisH protein